MAGRRGLNKRLVLDCGIALAVLSKAAACSSIRMFVAATNVIVFIAARGS
jgi:hypothetical protein